MFDITDINYNGFKKINKRNDTINIIKEIKYLVQEHNLEKNLFKKISSFLYGDFIEIKFINHQDECFYFFRNDVISSETLLKLFHNSIDTGKIVFKLDIKYDKKFFNLLVKYLIYNDNKDNIGTMVYNSKSWLYLKDRDSFNNNIIFSMNHLELRLFQNYIKFFKIKVLDFKVSAILDIISICKKNTTQLDKEPISKFI